ncbi:MAG: hypothetical protein KA419_05480 [Acidobacteria bacterium]|nr:hypothetical protein [Acidobacteriota bacterium]
MSESLLNAPSWEAVVGALPAGWMQAARWFRHKSDPIVSIAFHDGVDLTPHAAPCTGRVALLVVSVGMESGRSGLYQVPVLLGPAPGGDGGFPVEGGWAVREAVDVPAFHTAVRRLMDAGTELRGLRGTFRFERYPVKAPFQSRPLAQTSSNSLVLVKGDDVLKYIRGLEPGVSPELQMNRFFALRGTFVNLPPLTGALSWLPAEGGECTLAIAQRFVESSGDLWAWTQDFLKSFLDALPPGEGPVEADVVTERCREYLDRTTRLAEVLADLHRTLQSAPDDPAFAPQPVTPSDLGAWSAAMRSGAEAVFERIARLAPGEGPILRDFFDRFPSMRERALEAFGRLAGLDPAGWVKCRVHGDFHLGQALKTPDDFILMDFEGEPLKSQDQRVARYSPFKDVAGLLRSYNYAAYAALFDWMERHGADTPPSRAESAVLQWNAGVEAVFRRRYLASAGVAPSAGLDAFLALLKLEKAVYELDYEINNRPGWLRIPVSGIGSCLREVFSDENA